MSKAQLKEIIQELRVRLAKMPKSVAESRAEYAQYTQKLPVGADVTRSPCNADGVPCDWIGTPNAREDRVVLYLHGGGYVIGSTATHLGLLGNIARACAARCLSVEYRLAPEHPHPAAVEDGAAAYRWLLAQDIPPAHIVLMGDSAGGGLAIATLVHLRDSGVPLPAAAVTLSPWVDLEAIGETADERAESDPIIIKRGVQIFGKLYMAGQDLRTPLASPIYANVAGLPPVLVQVGTAEVLYDDATRLAHHLEKAGVATTLRVYEDMIHVWHIYAGMVDEADAAIDELAHFAIAHWPV